MIFLVGFTAFTGAPYVPSKRRELRRVLRELVDIDSRDLLVDMGSGDGLVLREAAKFGARAVGFELNPVLFVISKFFSARYKNIDIKLMSYWGADFPDETTIVYTFGEDRDIKKMYKKVQEQATRLGREIEFLSFAFVVPGIEPIKSQDAYYLYRIKPLRSRQA
jgi:hypothetical protein